MTDETKNALVKFGKTLAKTLFTAGVALVTSLLTQCGI